MEIAPVNAPILSVLGDLFRGHQRKEISPELFLTGNAHWVEKNINAYPLFVFPDPPSDSIGYVNRRSVGGEFDERSAKILGEWFQRCMRISSQNEANVTLLQWAKEILSQTLGGSPHIDQALATIRNRPMASDFFFKAMDVKRKDAERSRKS